MDLTPTDRVLRCGLFLAAAPILAVLSTHGFEAAPKAAALILGVCIGKLELGLVLDFGASYSFWNIFLSVTPYLRQLPLVSKLTDIWIHLCLYTALFILSGLGREWDTTQYTPEWLTFVCGCYDNRHKIRSTGRVLLIFLTATPVFDFVFRAQLLGQGSDVTFSRLGHVDHSTARIVIRHPETSQLSFRTTDQEQLDWSLGPVITPMSETDYVSVFVLDSLKPSTQYVYMTNTSLSGSFNTSDVHPKKWSLGTASCIMPFFPYNPLDSALRIRGLEYLSNHVSKVSMDMFLFLGDFIYIDIPYRFGYSNQHYRDAYRKIYASPSWSKSLLNMPWLHMYDDHEITNDFSGQRDAELWPNAMEPYFSYQQVGNPACSPKSNLAGKTYYTFKKGDVSFFVMDTRRYRSGPEVQDGPQKTMLGKNQLTALKQWLINGERSWKVVVSSVPFTRNWRGEESVDSWAGFLTERQEILEYMWDVKGVIVLSGDRHEHATTEIPSPDGTASVIEFSTSPLSQFHQPYDRQYIQIEDTDIEIFSHWKGISKFGVLDFDTEGEEWKMVYHLIVDGDEIWNKTLTLTKD